ncbi:S8 family peptidase [Croceicoccus naphthovorans]|uniref:S8 family peptidase n=1 Tax=Croceicoccus naphthovorans TaxID=1348774 RepID=UPI00146FE610|nr:S8 family peptidase [Croceicoccus naphthovorans]MBB3991265.1 subtilisin family serine protease [Croceicoccus naphthovorans]
MQGRRTFQFALSGCAIAALAACGGGGGGGGGGVISTPAPAPAPSPTPSPSPSPTPTPTASFNTQEYRTSDGPAQHNAVAAWQVGVTGQGVAIAVIDSGIDSDSREFAGRISPFSMDVAGNRAIDDEDGHGTQVAMVAAAARDNYGVMGIAYDATVVALRADAPGTCSNFDPTDSSSGCSFFDDDIAAGIDRAIEADARVINISLGGGSPSLALTNAMVRAANAGIVVVVSAGNDGGSIDPRLDPDNPDPFASGLLAAAPQNVIIVGSVDENDQFSAFSNKAGSDANFFITARGGDVCCVYQDGELYIEVENGTEYIYVNNGTSFSAPQVAGAAALLA